MRQAGLGAVPGSGYKRAPMSAIALWRWVLLGLCKSPGLGVLWLLLLAGQPLLNSLTPLPSSRGVLEVALDWCFPAGLVGTGLGLATLSRGAPFLARIDARTRFLGELGALGCAAAYLQLPILLGALAAGAAPGDLGRAALAILTTDLHLAAISLLLLLPTLSSPLRLSLFLGAAWLVPALCSADSLARGSAWLDAAAPLRAASGAVPRTLAPAVALALAAFLLRTRPTRSPAG